MNRRRLFGLALTTGAAMALGGCASQKLETYAQEKPVLDLRQYFNGTLDAYGVFTDYTGTVVKRFKVVMVCTWTGDEGVLDEDFTYSDGTKQKRIWRLTAGPDGSYTGVAQGVSAGNALNWRYTLALPVDGKTIEVQMDDWMYLVDEHVMLNKARMRKFGLPLGEVTLSFYKR